MVWRLLVYGSLIFYGVVGAKQQQADEYNDWLDNYNNLDSHLPHTNVPNPSSHHEHILNGHQHEPGRLWKVLKQHQQQAGAAQFSGKNTYEDKYPEKPYKSNKDDYQYEVPMHMAPQHIPPYLYGHMFPFMYPPYLPQHLDNHQHLGNDTDEDAEDLSDFNHVNHPGRKAHDRYDIPCEKEGLKRPSQSAYAGHLPEDIIRFNKLAAKLQEKYFKGGKMVHGRQGRLMEPINALLAMNPLTAWMVGQPLKEVAAEMEQTKAGVLSSIMAPFDNLLANKVNTFNRNVWFPYKQSTGIIEDNTNTDIKMAGIETCSNGDAVCDDYQQCIANGGTPIGSCHNCQDCATCCKYVYERESNTCASPILFFQSEEYPLTRSGYYSSSLSIRIRSDVCQVLIEFVDFELPIGKSGCFEDAYLEIINPMMPEGILGKGNSRFCGINTDQHVYLPVRGGDQLLLKVTTSGDGYKELHDGHEYDHEEKDKEHYIEYSDDFRFKIKVTQIIEKSSFKQIAVTSSMLVKNAADQNPMLASFLRKNDLLAEALPFVVDKLPAVDMMEFYANIRGKVPEYYQNLVAPEGCLQYYLDETGIVESFNYDGKSSMPKNLDYTICFKHHKHCGMSLKAIKFDIPACRKECMDGTAAIAGGFPCCTAGLRSSEEHSDDKDHDIEKWIGIDGTSDGKSRHKENQKRFFFCGKSLGHTNYIESDRQGPLHIQVYSDDKSYSDYNGNGVGFRLKYEVLDC